MAKAIIEKGDRFTKVDAPGIAWRVISSEKIFDRIPHAVLVQEDRQGRQMTISFIGLENASLYKRMPSI